MHLTFDWKKLIQHSFRRRLDLSEEEEKTFHSKQLCKICGGVSHGPYQDSTFARSDMYEAESTEGGHHINTLSA